MESDKSKVIDRPESLSAEQFTYDLPDEKIARFPNPDRTKSKLLYISEKEFSEGYFYQIKDWLPKNTLLLLNDTRVIHSRLIYLKENAKPIEVFCLEPLNADQGVWKAMVGNAKKWKSGKLEWKDGNKWLTAENIAREGKVFHIQFQWEGFDSFESALECFGQVPLPPYLQRESVSADKDRYQTVFSTNPGSVAAPTASLHFDQALLNELEQQGVKIAKLTLHVGAGTFWPMESSTLGEHEMHAERMEIPLATLRLILQHEGPIIPVGTTALRTLESLANLALRYCEKHEMAEIWCEQWEAYQKSENNLKSCVQVLYNDMLQNGRSVIQGTTKLMIAPGYSFRLANGLITNFHQPGSTLLVLVAAAMGERWKEAYTYALQHDFKFLSFGDSMCIYPLISDSSLR